MRKKTLFILCIIIGISFFNISTSFANSLENDGIKFVGEVRGTRKYFEGDTIIRESIDIDGYGIDDKGNTFEVQQRNILLPSYASMDKCKYTVAKGQDKCSGNLDIEIKPFNPNIVYDDFTIEPLKYNTEGKLESIKLSVKADFYRQFESVNFYNNIGNKLSIDYNKATIDTSNIQLIDGTYIIPYTVYFNNMNIKKENVYNTVTGTFDVVIESPQLFYSSKNNKESEETITPSLNATKVVLDTNTTFDVNLNNKISGSTYLWKTADADIVEVNSKNGKLKPISKGKSTITCEITLPDGNKDILESEVIVGYDENTPMLTDTILDLEVGDKFKINLENKTANSEYKWTSSNRDIVKVNSSNGRVTAIGIGEAYIICTINMPDNKVIILRCDVNVTDVDE